VTTLAVPVLDAIGRLLTPAEYDALPANPRREFVDGLVRMMATPIFGHQFVSHALRRALDDQCPKDLLVTGEIEVRLADLQRRVPDVLVVRAAGVTWRTSRVLPDQVVLAVEIVSPGSESTDRVDKPIEYARAGIRHFWRIEVESSVVVHAFRLGSGRAYVQAGVFRVGDTITVSGLDWVSVPVNDLTGEG